MQNFGKSLIIAIFLIISFLFFINSANAAIVIQQLDDTAETDFDYWGGYFTQKLSLTPNEFQGSFNRVELKILSQDGGGYIHTVWVKEINPNNPADYSLLFYTNWTDFGAPNQWNTIAYDVGNITTKSDKIYEFAVRGRYGYGLKVMGSANQNSYPYGDAYSEFGKLGSVKDLYFKIYSVPVISNLEQFKADGITPLTEGWLTTTSTIIFKAVPNIFGNSQAKFQIELKDFNQPFDGQDIIESGFVVSQTETTITKTGLTDGRYHWRARAVDSEGYVSDWQEFGSPSNIDFEIKTTVLEISDLKQLDDSVCRDWGNSGSLYQWGGQSLGAGLTGSFRTLKLHLKNGYYQSPSEYRIQICEADSITGFYGYGSGAMNCPTVLAEKIFNTGITELPDQINEIDFGQTYEFNPLKYYAINIRFESYSNKKICGSANDNSFVNGAGSYDSTFGSFGYLNNWSQFFRTLTDPVKDLYFEFATVNQPPTILGLNQFKSDATSTIPEGEITTESSPNNPLNSIIVFKANLTDPDNDQVKLQIEVKEYNQPFDETSLLESNLFPPGSEIILIKDSIAEGNYKWRVRAVDDKGSTSPWQEFGTAGNVDFEVKLPLSYKAANLAKELANHPEAYLWGGKGWDYSRGEFIPSSDILVGYEYLRGLTGVGVDCSGLVTWAFNRNFNSTKPAIENFVSYENANGQYLNNTEPINESELQPGDVMFFDFSPVSAPDGFIDHVSMYVGKSGGYDVVSAADRTQGIVPRSKDALKTLSRFRGFKQVVSAQPPAVLVSAHSPIDLVVTDPDGFTITPTTVVPSEFEYLREIPGVLYYSEMERGPDGNPIDRIYSPLLKTGDYIIQVLPALGVSLTSIYTLDFSTTNQSMTLAQDVSISQIPTNGYGITTSEVGLISSFTPVAIDIKPGSYSNSINLGSNGVMPVAILGFATFDVKQVNPTTIKLANAPVKLKSNGQPMASYEDVNGDGFTDIIVHIVTKALQLTKNDVKADLTGQLTSGTVIKGSDSVHIVP